MLTNLPSGTQSPDSDPVGRLSLAQCATLWAVRKDRSPGQDHVGEWAAGLGDCGGAEAPEGPSTVEGRGEDLGSQAPAAPGERTVLGGVCGLGASPGRVSPGGSLLGRHSGSFRLLLPLAWPPSSLVSQALPLLRRL